MPSLADLPEEMIVCIIDLVPLEDKRTLYSCALVCRSWFLITRPKMFLDILLDSRRTIDLLVQRVLRSDEMNPYLATTRFLRLYSDRQSNTPVVFVPVLYTFYGRFPKLEVLFLYGPNTAYAFNRVLEPFLLSQFSNLRLLKLYYCFFPSFNLIRRAISALPSLEELDMLDVRVDRVVQALSSWLPNLRRPSLRLRCFKYQSFALLHEEDFTEDLMFWLSMTCSPSHIETLDFRIRVQDLWGNVSPNSYGFGCESFFQRMASSISSLTLDTAAINPISYFSNLSTLTLAPKTVHRSSAWADISTMLGEVQSPMLRHLHFNGVYYHGPEPGNRLHINDGTCFCLLTDSGVAGLDPVLARDVFKNLDKVEFCLERITFYDVGGQGRGGATPERPHPKLKGEELLAPMEEILPQLTARGVIAFDEYWLYFPQN